MNTEPKLPAYTIRLLSAADASGVTQLVKSVYDDSYYPPDLYDPQEIMRLNELGHLISIVALDAAGEVVGHYALERPHPLPIAEASDAIVHVDHRHHHLLEEMRVTLRQEAIRLGLTGLVGYPVTNHVYSQKAEDHFGAHPCGVMLGLWPQTFHNMPEPLAQRMSFVVYFKYLNPPEKIVHVLTRHQQMLARIAAQYMVRVELKDAAPAEGEGEIAIEYESAVQAGVIRVRRVGADTVSAVRRFRDDLCHSGAKALTLELPLSQTGTAEICVAVEEFGFFFCGLGPAFAADGDAVILQYLVEDLDPTLVLLENPFSLELLAYVSEERRRVLALKSEPEIGAMTGLDSSNQTVVKQQIQLPGDL